MLIDGRYANKLNTALTKFLLQDINNEQEIVKDDYQCYKCDFLKNEDELQKAAISRIIDLHTQSVSYSGRNNVTYTKTCIPKQKDIVINYCKTLYYPKWDIQIKSKQKNYHVSFIESNNKILKVKDDTLICQICHQKIEVNRWYCEFCGSIICKKHIKVTRWDKVIICTDCSICKRFIGAKKYFKSTEELKAFENYYRSLPLHKKIRENTYLTYFIVFLVIGTVIYLLYLLTNL